jgi:MYXO-CTERM domain-containing protein
MIRMKIRDFLVIAFTAVVALLLFMRSALADGSGPGEGASGSCGGDGTIDPDRSREGMEGESLTPAGDSTDASTPGQSLSCSASPGAATTTLCNSLAALVAVGLVARRRRR